MVNYFSGAIPAIRCTLCTKPRKKDFHCHWGWIRSGEANLLFYLKIRFTIIQNILIGYGVFNAFFVVSFYNMKPFFLKLSWPFL